jgi:hypothetical protein
LKIVRLCVAEVRKICTQNCSWCSQIPLNFETSLILRGFRWVALNSCIICEGRDTLQATWAPVDLPGTSPEGISLLVQSFGRYESLEEAARAYDIGYILFRGIRGKLNFAVSNYIDIASGMFHDQVELPLLVAHAVSLYLKRGCTGSKGRLEEREAARARMSSLFRPTNRPAHHEAFLEKAAIFGAALGGHCSDTPSQAPLSASSGASEIKEESKHIPFAQVMQLTRKRRRGRYVTHGEANAWQALCPNKRFVLQSTEDECAVVEGRPRRA